MADSFRDFPGDPGSEAMMHVGPVAYTEAIYDRIKKCTDVDDCGEYVVMSAGVFANTETSWLYLCPRENAKINSIKLLKPP